MADNGYVNIDDHYDWDEIQIQNYNMLNFELPMTKLQFNDLIDYPLVINELIYSYYDGKRYINDIIYNVTIKKRDEIFCSNEISNFKHSYCSCFCLPWKIKILFKTRMKELQNITLSLYDSYILFIHYNRYYAYNRYSLTIFEMFIHYTNLIDVNIGDFSSMKVKTSYNRIICKIKKYENNVVGLLHIATSIAENFYNNNVVEII